MAGFVRRHQALHPREQGRPPQLLRLNKPSAATSLNISFQLQLTGIKPQTTLSKVHLIKSPSQIPKVLSKTKSITTVFCPNMKSTSAISSLSAPGHQLPLRPGRAASAQQLESPLNFESPLLIKTGPPRNRPPLPNATRCKSLPLSFQVQTKA